MFILVNRFSKIYLYIQNKDYFTHAHFLLSLTLCMLGNISWFFLWSADSFQSQLFPKRLLGTPSESNSLNPDLKFVEYDLGPNCLQRLSADNMELKVPNMNEADNKFHNYSLKENCFHLNALSHIKPNLLYLFVCWVIFHEFVAIC